MGLSYFIGKHRDEEALGFAADQVANSQLATRFSVHDDAVTGP
jgi:hypothetical protein